MIISRCLVYRIQWCHVYGNIWDIDGTEQLYHPSTHYLMIDSDVYLIPYHQIYSIRIFCQRTLNRRLRLRCVQVVPCQWEVVNISCIFWFKQRHASTEHLGFYLIAEYIVHIMWSCKTKKTVLCRKCIRHHQGNDTTAIELRSCFNFPNTILTFSIPQW